MHSFYPMSKVLNLFLILVINGTIQVSSTLAIPLDSSPSTAPSPFNCSGSSDYYNCSRQPFGGKGKKGGYSQQILAETQMPKTPTLSPAKTKTLAPDGSMLSHHPSSHHVESRSSSPSTSGSSKSSTRIPTMQTNKNIASSSYPSLAPSSTPSMLLKKESFASPTSVPSSSFGQKEGYGSSNRPSSSWKQSSNAPSSYVTTTSEPGSTTTSTMPTIFANESFPSLPPSKPSNSTQLSLLESIGCYDSPVDIFGSISSHQTIVPFSYEILYDPSFRLKDMIRSLEVSIVLGMLRAWPIPGCNIDANASTTESPDLVKDIKVTGLSSRPYDVVVSDKACTSSIVNTTHACDSIDGRFSIFYRNPNATDYITQLLAFIQKGMENDLFVGSHAGIVKVIFTMENLKRDNPATEGRGQEDPPSSEVDNSMLPVFAWYLVASAGVVIVGVALRKWFARRRALSYGELDMERKSEEEPVN